MIHIRPSLPAEGEVLLALWLRSVRASHGFLCEEDIAFYHPMVRDLLAAAYTFRVACCGEGGLITGFMALDTTEHPTKLEALFVDPPWFRRGCGAALVRHAITFAGDLTLDVNEQNPDALAFYIRMGFVQTGRSPQDGAGRPFPLIHMRLGREGKGLPGKA